MENQENMAKVQELMKNASDLRLGGNATAGVPIDYTSLMNTKFTGTVVFKRPNMLDLMKIGGMKSEILRTAGVKDIKLIDKTVNDMAQVVATLKIVVAKSPEWLLDIDKVEEPDLLWHVFYKYQDWEDTFRKPSEDKPTTDSGTAGGEETVATS